MRVELLHPPGARSCRDDDGDPGLGGVWVDAEDLAREGGPRQSLARCLSGLNPVVRAHVFAELTTLVLGAVRGELTFWDYEAKAGQVKQMVSKRRVLEIRFTGQIDPEGGHRHIRLYFTEPRHHPVLLALLLEWKADDPDGKPEQQRHILEADRRIDRHYATCP